VLVDVTRHDQVEAAVKEASQAVYLTAHPQHDSLIDPRRSFEVNLGRLLDILGALRADDLKVGNEGIGE